MVDPASNVIYGVQYPERIYETFESIPPGVVATLLFIEDRQLLDERRPFLNPAINWARLGRAVMVDTLVRIGNEFLFSGDWWISILPGAMLVALSLSVNLLGDWLRDALNPRLAGT